MTYSPLGRVFTTRNPFAQSVEFKQWADDCMLVDQTVLEPFAGANHLIRHLQSIGYARKYSSLDIEPGAPDVEQADTLMNFPRGWDVCITNPPWLARNSAMRKGLTVPGPYSDLYLFALDKCLAHCGWVAAIVPESFIRQKMLRERLRAFESIPEVIFDDTEHPTGLALFGPDLGRDPGIWSGGKWVGRLSWLEQRRPLPHPDGPHVAFNVSRGNAGLFALDGTKARSIFFCEPERVADRRILRTSRSVTRLQVCDDVRLEEWNSMLASYRMDTWDMGLMAYKGRRADGWYRRRCDWKLARGIIHAVSRVSPGQNPWG